MLFTKLFLYDIILLLYFKGEEHEKIISLILSFAIILSLGIIASSANLTSSDALTILRAAAGTITLTAEQQAKYDLDGDGKITTADAVAVLRSIAGTSGGALDRSNVSRGNTISFGNYEWRVLEVQNDRALILSTQILDEKHYHNSNTQATWEMSDIRAYLNGTFYNGFKASDKASIIQVTNKNPSNFLYDAGLGGADTQDYVFLLSFDEVKKYLGDESWARVPGAAPTMNDAFNAVRVVRKSDGTAMQWWLRSPGGDNNKAMFVADTGSVSLHGTMIYRTVYGLDDMSNLLGVVPAMWIKI